MTLPPRTHLSHAEKDALILALRAQIQTLTAPIAALDAKVSDPPKTPDNSSTAPSKGQQSNRPEQAKGGGRPRSPRLPVQRAARGTARAAAASRWLRSRRAWEDGSPFSLNSLGLAI